MRLAEAYRLIAELTAQAGRLAAQVERLSARVGELERQARMDSSTSSRPPSSDSPYRKKGGDRSLRERGRRRPGKQPGDPGSTMSLVDDPDESIDCPPTTCRGCGADLASAPVTARRRHQVTDIEPAPAPKVIQYVAQAKECAGCGAVSVGELPAHVRARASYGPETCAQARSWSAATTSRSTGPRCCCASWPASRSRPGGWPGSAAGPPPWWKPAGSSTGSGSCCGPPPPCTSMRPRPGRPAGPGTCTWPAPAISPACTPVTGQRTRSTPGRSCQLPGHHRPRRLRGLRPPDLRPARLVRGSPAQGPQGPVRLRARPAGMGVRDGRPADRGTRRRRVRPGRRAVRPGRRRPGRPGHPLPHAGRRRAGANLYRRSAIARDARRLTHRFLGFEDLILRFATRPDLDIFSNNEAGRTIRPVKVQQRSSGGCWLPPGL